jgi:hypothetical protein
MMVVRAHVRCGFKGTISPDKIFVKMLSLKRPRWEHETPCICHGQVRKWPTINTYQFTLLWKTADVATSRLLISICCSLVKPSFSNQSEPVLPCRHWRFLFHIGWICVEGIPSRKLKSRDTAPFISINRISGLSPFIHEMPIMSLQIFPL